MLPASERDGATDREPRMPGTMNRALVSPESVGVHPERLRLLIERVRCDVEDGPLPSAQLAIAKDGRLLADVCFGDVGPETRYVLHSAGRPVLASVMWRLLGDGLLSLDQRVAEIIPEFATNGKEVISVFQLLTQTAGFPLAPLGFPQFTEPSRRLEAFAKWRLTYEPGSRFEFHLTSVGWIIAEIVERLVGVSLADYVRDYISSALGLSMELGVPPERQLATVAPLLPLRTLTGEVDRGPYSPWFLNDPAILAAGEPSHGLVATAADMALLYQAFYHSGLWSPAVVAEATSALVTMDISGGFGTTTHVGRTGLFVMIEGPATASSSTYGHSGAPSQLTWCDPEVGLSFAFLHNGYGATGYDKTRSGASRSLVISTMAGDLVV
jgi:CubicO group peptidase (beta-lactamase class C family)